jgi:hypothetical protein
MGLDPDINIPVTKKEYDGRTIWRSKDLQKIFIKQRN